MIDKYVLGEVLAEAQLSGGDFAEIFAEDTSQNAIVLVDGKVDKLNGGRSHGVGIRIYKGLNSVYGFTNDTSREGLLATARQAAGVIGDLADAQRVDIALQVEQLDNRFPIERYPSTVDNAEKIDMMRDTYGVIKDYSTEISQSVVSYSDVDQRVLIANSEGLLKEDRRTRTRLHAQAIASNGVENQTGRNSPGRHMGFEMFKQEIDPLAVGREAARIAVEMLHADYAPSGEMPVIIDNAFGGVIFHEACGHSLEATLVAKNASEFAGKLGQQIASPIVTAIDDGTISRAWGSQNIDDEGHAMRRNVLIENGILKGYLVDRLNGRRMQMAPTGSSRRQSYRYAPTSRMTNTFIAPGHHTVDEIFNSTDRGFYAKRLGGGSVNPATGQFNFTVLEGYLVEKGKIVKPLRGASLIGKGSEILQRIDRISDNLAFSAGMCGSLSGSVPVYVGQPMIRVSSIVVGGK